MASDVDICNMALSHIGDTAIVTSINPSDGSIQAGYCSVFYAAARDSLLSNYQWGFATVRQALAQLTNTITEWQYAYQLPSDCLTPQAVYAANATDDYSQNWQNTGGQNSPIVAYGSMGFGQYSPLPFSYEVDASGNEVIYCNDASPILRYTKQVTNTASYSHQFVMALSYQLAAMLAGPIIKGSEGSAKSSDMLKLAQFWTANAAENDANQRRNVIQQNVKWIANR